MFHSLRTIEGVYQQASEIEYELKLARTTQPSPRIQDNQQIISNPKVTNAIQPPRD